MAAAIVTPRTTPPVMSPLVGPLPEEFDEDDEGKVDWGFGMAEVSSGITVRDKVGTKVGTGVVTTGGMAGVTSSCPGETSGASPTSFASLALQ